MTNSESQSPTPDERISDAKEVLSRESHVTNWAGVNQSWQISAALEIKEPALLEYTLARDDLNRPEPTFRGRYSSQNDAREWSRIQVAKEAGIAASDRAALDRELIRLEQVYQASRELRQGLFENEISAADTPDKVNLIFESLQRYGEGSTYFTNYSGLVELARHQNGQNLLHEITNCRNAGELGALSRRHPEVFDPQYRTDQDEPNPQERYSKETADVSLDGLRAALETKYRSIREGSQSPTLELPSTVAAIVKGHGEKETQLLRIVMSPGILETRQAAAAAYAKLEQNPDRLINNLLNATVNLASSENIPDQFLAATVLTEVGHLLDQSQLLAPDNRQRRQNTERLAECLAAGFCAFGDGQKVALKIMVKISSENPKDSKVLAQALAQMATGELEFRTTDGAIHAKPDRQTRMAAVDALRSFPVAAQGEGLRCCLDYLFDHYRNGRATKDPLPDLEALTLKVLKEYESLPTTRLGVTQFVETLGRSPEIDKAVVSLLRSKRGIISKTTDGRDLAVQELFEAAASGHPQYADVNLRSSALAAIPELAQGQGPETVFQAAQAVCQVIIFEKPSSPFPQTNESALFMQAINELAAMGPMLLTSAKVKSSN